ncbi:MAG: hypothetical protein ACOYVF_13785 [Candidatus Zixiibacteriota bacterium]
MKRFFWFLTLLCCGLALSFVMGCSDDDDENPLKEGDPNSAEFQFFEDVVADQSMELSQYALFSTLALLDSFLIPEEIKKSGYNFATAEGEPLIVFDSVTFDTSGGWYIFYFEFAAYQSGILEVDTLEVVGTDSIKVYQGGLPVYVLVGEPDSLEAREHIRAEWWNNLGEEADAAGHYRLRIAGAPPANTMINAFSSDSLSSRFVPVDDGLSLCSLMVTASSTIDNLVINLDSIDTAEVCPTAGAIHFALNIDLDCVGDTTLVDISGGWTMDMVFDGAMETITVTNGEYQWTKTDLCGSEE